MRKAADANPGIHMDQQEGDYSMINDTSEITSRPERLPISLRSTINLSHTSFEALEYGLKPTPRDLKLFN